MPPPTAPLSWIGIVRLGLVQTALGAIVVLTTSTLNRVMVVELALPAMLPGLLVGLHYAIQILRPRLGYGSDVGGRRTPWIVGGMLTLAIGGTAAAIATAWMGSAPVAGITLAVIAFVLIGLGVGAAGTSLLVLMAKQVAPQRRAAAATIVWVMMIAGFVVTALVAGHFLDPFSPARLVVVTGTVSMAAVVVTLLAIWRVERTNVAPPAADDATERPRFRAALAEVWRETQARRFTVFVFVSMLAYSAQDLILEPFAGSVFGLTPGQSTQLAGVQHAGVLLGMILTALAVSPLCRFRCGSLRTWMIGGCLASALALLALSSAGAFVPHWPLRASVFALGAANGAFAVAAIGSMMQLAGQGRARREGVRMGLWGAAQAIAFGLGGFLGAAAVDLSRAWLGAAPPAYALVFFSQAVLFVLAAVLASRIAPIAGSERSAPRPLAVLGAGDAVPG